MILYCTCKNKSKTIGPCQHEIVVLIYIELSKSIIKHITTLQTVTNLFNNVFDCVPHKRCLKPFCKKKKKETKIKFKRKYKMEKNVEKKIINEDNNKNDNGIKTKERRFTSFNKK